MLFIVMLVYSENKSFLVIFYIGTKLTVVVLWILLGSVYQVSKLETFPPLTSVMSQDLALQQGASQLKTTSANLWTFPINITSPSRICFVLFNNAELRHYRVILFHRIIF
jgi:hypothetical protein